jgi:hypothetical protein
MKQNEDNIQLLKEIEENYPVNTVKINGLPVWQYLRINLSTYIIHKNTPFVPLKKSGIFKRLKRFLFTVSCLPLLNKNFKYLFFSTLGETRLIDDSYSDRIAHNLFKILGKDLLAVLDFMGNDWDNYNLHYHPFCINKKVFDFFKKPLKNLNMENWNILDRINEKYRMDLDYTSMAVKFMETVRIFDRYFKKHKPEAVFVKPYYGMNQAVIYAAHLNNIKVVELQHGLINDKHRAYQAFSDNGRECIPDYILTFGDYVKKYVSSYLVDEKHLVPIGYFYIEHIKENAKNNLQLQEYFDKLRKKYKKIVAVASSQATDDIAADFVKKAAKMDAGIAYLFIFRFYNVDSSKYQFPENVIVNPEFDFYQNALYSDFHATVYSTCALEAPFLGVRNLIMNINNLGKTIYQNLLKEGSITHYCETPEEMVRLIKTLPPLPRAEIEKEGSSYYKQNNYENIRQFLLSIGIKLNK